MSGLGLSNKSDSRELVQRACVDVVMCHRGLVVHIRIV